MKPLVYRQSRRKRKARKAKPHKLHVAKGDRVRVISGEHRGSEGTVQRVLPRRNKVVIEGVNIVSRHRRATQTTEGGIVKFPAPIHASNLMLIDPKTGAPTRVRRRKDKDGTVERLSVRSGQPIPRTR